MNTESDASEEPEGQDPPYGVRVSLLAGILGAHGALAGMMANFCLPFEGGSALAISGVTGAVLFAFIGIRLETEG